MARDVLNVPISTVASESAFSQARQQLGDTRHSLGSNALEVLVCLRDWIRSEQRNQGKEDLDSPEDEELGDILTHGNPSEFNTPEEDPEKVTPDIIESRYALTKRQGARYVPAAFLTGLLDPVKSREEFVQLFAELEGSIPVLVLATAGSPKRSKAEMEALREAKWVSKYIEVPGALLPQEEYPEIVAEQLYRFLQEKYEL